MATVLITGGSGLVGRHLSRRLSDKGYSVALLGRSKRSDLPYKTFVWDVEANKLDREAIEIADHIIHLAGANIMKVRWNAEGKKQILDSRVKTAQLLFRKVRNQDRKLSSFISASAVGYYGTAATGQVFTENDPPASDFLADVCRQWEAAADLFGTGGVRVVKIRTSPVMASDGGVLPVMKLPANMGLGAALGNGQQHFPWIHIDDLCNLYLRAVEEQEMRGAYNAATPDQPTNKEFMRTLARVLKRPFWLPNVPAWLMKLALGERGKAFLGGSRVSCDKILDAGFRFSFPEVQEALSDLLVSPNRKK